MATEHDYRLQLRWEGDPATGTASYAAYDRQFRVTFAGKPDLVGSANPAFRGDPAVHDPEDLFLSSIASCHMLAYLALCAREGIRVVAYVDDPHGRLVLRPGGGGRFEQVVLHPRVEIAAGGDVARAIALHAEAHARCFIASSCSVLITCDPTVTIATDPASPRAAPRQDLAVRLRDEPGALAELGEVLGREGISLEGGGGFAIGDGCIVHFLVRDGERAASALRAAGIEVLGVRETIAVRLAQGEPGQLGKLARAMGDAGVNIACVYSDHDHQLIVCVDDVEAGARVAAAWRNRGKDERRADGHTDTRVDDGTDDRAGGFAE